MRGPGRCVCWSAAASYFCCLLRCWCSGRRWCAVGPGCLVCPWAAARPRAVRAASFARRVASKPGQAPPPPTGTAAWPSIPPAPSTPVGPGVLAWGWRVALKPGLALPPPTGTAAWPSGPSGTLHTSGACCAADDSPRLEARPGPAAADQHRGPPCHRPRAPWQVPRPLWHRGQARRSLRRSPVVCVFWIGSSVVDRNGASG